MSYQKKSNHSFTFLEVLISILFVTILGYFIYGAFINFLKTTTSLRLSLLALNVLESEMEIIKNMNYEDIGIEDGYPRGKLKRIKYVNLGNLKFSIRTYIRNIDDPYDGTVTSTPQDLAPADYKLVELEIECLNCGLKFKPQKLTTLIAPKNLEMQTNNGSLFIRAINANGEPIPYAKIIVRNNVISPPIYIEDYTNNDGILPLIDIPTGTNAYAIEITKPGYSTEKTYPPGDPNNPNPINPHATVKEQTLTLVTLAIDKLSNLIIKTQNKFCQPIGNVNLRIDGTKLIGRNPDVIKFSTTTQTDNNGRKNLENIEWDEYKFYVLDNNYILKGTNPLLPIILPPSTTKNITLTLTSQKDNYLSLLVIVKDDAGNPVNFATVTLTKSNYSNSLITNLENYEENNWLNNYSEKSENIEIDSTGAIKLKYLENGYPTSSVEWLISQTIDFGTSTEIRRIIWSGDEPLNTDIKLQIAINSDGSNWNFVGPDGTSATYFEDNIIENIDFLRNFRYLRYKVYLKTDDPNLTPVFKKINFSFSSFCLPPGQVLFDNLSAGNYTLKVEKEGYQIFSTNLEILDKFNIFTAKLTK